MTDRRRAKRPDAPERRTFPRPPLWLNLVLLIIAVATFAVAQHHRNVIRRETAVLFKPTPSNPAELNRIREELSEMDLTRDQLAKQLDARLAYLQSVQGEEFYISIDTAKQRMEFRLGKDVVRDCPVQIGESKTIKWRAKTWTFVPVKGAFNVVGKEEDMPWTVPQWLYAMDGKQPPEERPTIKNGLGKYVVLLPDNYVIHSAPSADSPLQGPKPGSFMVPEADLAAIWPRISKQTRVYIF
ncbi:MAG TPA: L,D-transpeptidase [Thermoanaerobaculia bacterium]|nr:L,D-transpeptidase [Thermoanaerobaculia bacterium]